MTSARLTDEEVRAKLAETRPVETGGRIVNGQRSTADLAPRQPKRGKAPVSSPANAVVAPAHALTSNQRSGIAVPARHVVMREVPGGGVSLTFADMGEPTRPTTSPRRASRRSARPARRAASRRVSAKAARRAASRRS